MDGSELHTTSYMCQPLPDFKSLAGDACEHFSQVLTHVKHRSLNIDLVNKLHIHLPLGIWNGASMHWRNKLKILCVKRCTGAPEITSPPTWI